MNTTDFEDEHGGDDDGDWNNSTPPHPEQNLVEPLVHDRLSAFAATIEPNWQKVEVKKNHGDNLTFKDIEVKVTIHGPLHGETNIGERVKEVVGAHLYPKWLEVLFHSICSQGDTITNDKHQIELVPGRTQFKLRDPRALPLEQRQEMYRRTETRAKAHTLLVWDEPYWAAMVDPGVGHGWLELVVLDENDQPTGDVIRCHESELRRSVSKIGTEDHPSSRIDSRWPPVYRAMPFVRSST
jgi:hypothetical protein